MDNTSQHASLCIRVKCYGGKDGKFMTKRVKLKGNQLRLDVSIPYSRESLFEKLSITEAWNAQLERKHRDNPFLLTVQVSDNEQNKVRTKNLIQLFCSSLEEGNCHVKLHTCKVSADIDIMIEADQVVIPPRRTIQCEKALILKSLKTLSVQSPVSCPYINLTSKTGQVRLSPEAIIRTKQIHTVGIKTFIEGNIAEFIGNQNNQNANVNNNRVNNLENTENVETTEVKINVTGDLHIGRDANLGTDRTRRDGNLPVHVLNLKVGGDICNFGDIEAAEMIEIKCENLKTCRSTKDDTAHRYLRGIEDRLGINEEHLSTGKFDKLDMHSAINSCNLQQIASLLRQRTDVNAPNRKNNVSPSKQADKALSKSFIPIEKNGLLRDREKPDSAASLIKSWNKRSGSITAPKVFFHASETIEDASQIHGKTVTFDVGDDIIVEDQSIWTSGIIQGNCDGTVSIEGTAKLQCFNKLRVNTFCNTSIGICVVSTGGHLIVDNLFHNQSVLFHCKGQFLIETGIFQQDQRCTVESKQQLILRISKDSDDWYGTVKAESLLIAVSADVAEDAEIIANDKCVIETNTNTNSEQQGALIHKGDIKVSDGSLFVISKRVMPKTQKKCAIRKENPDVTSNGTITARGIRASSAFIKMASKSTTNIQHDIDPKNTDTTTSNRNGYECPKIYLLVGQLYTEKNSHLLFLTENRPMDIEMCCLNTWKHSGQLKIEKESQHDNRFHVQVSKFHNTGELNNIEFMQLEVLQCLINFKPISVQYHLEIAGGGDIYTRPNGSLLAREGPIAIHHVDRLHVSSNAYLKGKMITIKTLRGLNGTGTRPCKSDVLNKGEISSLSELTIVAGNIKNCGTIDSKKDVQLQWTTTEKGVELGGFVKTPTLLMITTDKSQMFTMKCFSGCSESADEFVLPKNGLVLECPLGFPVIDTIVTGESAILVRSNHGCCIRKHIDVSNIKLVFEELIEPTELPTIDTKQNMAQDCDVQSIKLVHDESMQCNELQEADIKQHLTPDDMQNETSTGDIGNDDKEAYSKPKFFLNIVEDTQSNTASVAMFDTLESETNDCENIICIRTQGSSQLRCRQVMDISSKLVCDGDIQITRLGTIHANEIEMTKRSQCKIYTESGTSSDQRQMCRFLSEKSINLNGNINHDLTEDIHLLLNSNKESIYVCGIVNISELTVVSNEKIILNGATNVTLNLMLTKAEVIDIQADASIKCNNLICQPPPGFDESISKYLHIQGKLQVVGSISCRVKEFKMESTSCLEMCQTKTTTAVTSTNDNVSNTCKTNENIAENLTENNSVEGPNYNEPQLNIEVDESAYIAGLFICSRDLSYGILSCKEELHFVDNFTAKISTNELTFCATKMIKVYPSCDIAINRGKVCMTNARENEEEITGDIVLSGHFIGANESFTSENTTQSPVSNLEIEGKNVTFEQLSIERVHTNDFLAAMTLSIDDNSCITQGSSLNITVTTLEHKGEISKFEKVNSNVDNMLVLGKIIECEEIRIDAELAAFNSGHIQGQKTGISSPIYMNCPPDFDGQTASSSQLGGDEQKELIIEGLLCIIVGSQLQGRNINIKSNLQFEFASQKSTVPGSSDLDRWKSVMDNSLSKISDKSDDHSGIKALVEQAMKIKEVICKLGVASHMCQDIVALSQKICKGGLSEFRMDDLLGSLNKAHSEYSMISSINFDFKVRIRLRRVKNAGKRVAKNLMNKIFGPKSFSKTLEFRSKDGEIEEGIDSWTFINIGEHVDMQTRGNFTALSLELNGCKGLWKNEGHIEACGDICISASMIKFRGSGQGRLMKAVMGGINIQADNVDVENTESKYLNVEANENARVDNANVEKDIYVKATKKAEITNATSDNLAIETEGDINIGNIETHSELSAVSNKGNIAVDSKVEANNAHLSAEKGRISLAGKSGKANHIFGSLTLKTKEFEDINKLLNKEDLYKDLKISDSLGLIVEDQNIVLANSQKLQHSLTIQAARIDVCGNLESNKCINLVATKASLNIGHGVNLKAGENASLVGKENVTLNSGSNVVAGENVYVESTAGSVDVLSSNITAGKTAALIADKDVNVNTEKHGKTNTLLEWLGLNQSSNKGSSIKAGDDIIMESKSESINILASEVEAGKSVAMNAEKDINIKAKKKSGLHELLNIDGPTNKSVIKAGSGDSENKDPAISMVAGRDLNIHASDVTSTGANVFKAKRDINITANTYQTVKRKKKSSWLGLKTETTTTTTTHVEHSTITGKSNTFSAEGNFTSKAGKIHSEMGTKVHAKGSVNMLDIVARTKVEKTTNVLGGLLYHKNETAKSEKSHGTLVQDTSALANTEIISDTSNITWVGSSIKTQGNLTEKAKQGKVTHSKRILNNSVDTNECGFYFSQENAAFGYKVNTSNNTFQTTSDDCMEVGGNCIIEAKEFAALNSFDVKVENDMTIDAKMVRFEGASLHSTNRKFGFDIGVKMTSVRVGVEYGQGSDTTQQAQTLYIGGKLKLVGTKDAIFDNCEADVEKLEGEVENMEVISRADTHCSFDVKVGIGFDCATETPELDIGGGYSHSKRVNQASAINVRSGSNGLSVKNLSLTGAAMVFDGDVHDFASNIVSHDVHESFTDINASLSISKPKPKKIKGSVSLGVQHSHGRFQSAIGSKNGTIDESLKRKVNTDLDRQRVEDYKMGFSFSAKFEGKPSKVIKSVGKDLVKAVGEEALKACGEKLIKELGLPESIVGDIIAIAKGEKTLEDVAKFAVTQIGKACLPDGLAEALEAIIADGNPIKLITWVCVKIGIDIQLIVQVIEVLRGSSSNQEIIKALIVCAAKYLPIPEEVVVVSNQLLNFKDNKGKSKLDFAKSSSLVLMNSKEGQLVLKKLCSYLKVPEEVPNIVIDVLTQTRTVDKAFIIIQTIAMQLNIPELFIKGLKDALLKKDITGLVDFGLSRLGLDKRCSQSVIKTMKGGKRIEDVIPEIIKCIAKCFGIGDISIQGIQMILAGEKPKGGKKALVIHLITDVGNSKQGQRVKDAVLKKLEHICSYLDMPEQIVNEITALSQSNQSKSTLRSVAVISLFIAENCGVPKDAVTALKSIVVDKDPAGMINWVAKSIHVEEKFMLALLRDVMNGCNLKKIASNLIKAVAEHYKVGNKDLLSDIDLILDGKKPKHILKHVTGTLSNDSIQVLMSLVLSKLKEIELPKEILDCLSNSLTMAESSKDTLWNRFRQCFQHLIKSKLTSWGIPVEIYDFLISLLDQETDENARNECKKKLKHIVIEFAKSKCCDLEIPVACVDLAVSVLVENKPMNTEYTTTQVKHLANELVQTHGDALGIPGEIMTIVKSVFAEEVDMDSSLLVSTVQKFAIETIKEKAEQMNFPTQLVDVLSTTLTNMASDTDPTPIGPMLKQAAVEIVKIKIAATQIPPEVVECAVQIFQDGFDNPEAMISMLTEATKKIVKSNCATESQVVELFDIVMSIKQTNSKNVISKLLTIGVSVITSSLAKHGLHEDYVNLVSSILTSNPNTIIQSLNDITVHVIRDAATRLRIPDEIVDLISDLLNNGFSMDMKRLRSELTCSVFKGVRSKSDLTSVHSEILETILKAINGDQLEDIVCSLKSITTNVLKSRVTPSTLSTIMIDLFLEMLTGGLTGEELLCRVHHITRTFIENEIKSMDIPINTRNVMLSLLDDHKQVEFDIYSCLQQLASAMAIQMFDDADIPNELFVKVLSRSVKGQVDKMNTSQTSLQIDIMTFLATKLGKHGVPKKLSCTVLCAVVNKREIDLHTIRSLIWSMSRANVSVTLDGLGITGDIVDVLDKAVFSDQYTDIQEDIRRINMESMRLKIKDSNICYEILEGLEAIQSEGSNHQADLQNIAMTIARSFCSDTGIPEELIDISRDCLHHQQLPVDYDFVRVQTKNVLRKVLNDNECIEGSLLEVLWEMFDNNDEEFISILIEYLHKTLKEKYSDNNIAVNIVKIVASNMHQGHESLPTQVADVISEIFGQRIKGLGISDEIVRELVSSVLIGKTCSATVYANVQNAVQQMVKSKLVEQHVPEACVDVLIALLIKVVSEPNDIKLLELLAPCIHAVATDIGIPLYFSELLTMSVGDNDRNDCSQILKTGIVQMVKEASGHVSIPQGLTDFLVEILEKDAQITPETVCNKLQCFFRRSLDDVVCKLNMPNELAEAFSLTLSNDISFDKKVERIKHLVIKAVETKCEEIGIPKSISNILECAVYNRSEIISNARSLMWELLKTKFREFDLPDSFVDEVITIFKEETSTKEIAAQIGRLLIHLLRKNASTLGVSQEIVNLLATILEEGNLSNIDQVLSSLRAIGLRAVQTKLASLNIPNKLIELLKAVISEDGCFTPEKMVTSLKEISLQIIESKCKTWGIPNEMVEVTLDVIKDAECMDNKQKMSKMYQMGIAIVQSKCEEFGVPKAIIDVLDIALSSDMDFDTKTKSLISCLQNVAKDTFQSECVKYGIPAEVVDVVTDILKGHTPDEALIALVSTFAVSRGVPEKVATGITDFIVKRDPNPLAVCIAEKTKIQTELVLPILTFVRDKVFNKESIINMLKNVCRHFGVSCELIDQIEKALHGKLPPKVVKSLVLDIGMQFVIPKLRDLAINIGVPHDIVDVIIGFIGTDNLKDSCFQLVDVLARKIGVPEGVFIAIKDIFLDKNYDRMAGYISSKSGIDKALIIAMFAAIHNGKTTIEGVKNIPVCIARHYKVTEELIGCMQSLIDRKKPSLDMKTFIKEIIITICANNVNSDILDLIFNVVSAEDWMERVLYLLRYVASRINFPEKCVDGIVELVQKKDPSKLIDCLADTLNIKADLLKIVFNALMKGESPKVIVQNIAESQGIPKEALAVIEEIIMQRSKQGKCNATVKRVWTTGLKFDRIKALAK